jgi:hypothetical protein
MPRYMIEREFPAGLHVPVDDAGARACRGIVEANALGGVTWIHSYVSTDKKRTFCIYDAPTPEAIRLSAERTHLPIERIVEVRVLDPYFYC